jgi:renalase
VTAASPRIAVIGAGIAGIAAVRELQAGNATVEVFDKGRASGGRVATRRRDGAQFDHGAQFFTVRDDGFDAVIAPLLRDGTVAEWRGPFRTLRTGEFGADPRPGARYVGVPGMSALPRMLSGGFAVATGARLAALRRADDVWHLDVEREGSVRRHHQAFDAILLAIPPAQAMDLLAASRIDGVAFLAAQRAQQRLQPCLCAMAMFAQPIDEAMGGMFVQDEALAWAAHDGGKPMRHEQPAYVLHATAAWSATNFDREPLASARELLAAFSRSLARSLPEVVSLDAHRWRYAIAADGAAEGFVADAGQRIWLASDAFTGGRVEGAYCSGRSAAQSMLRALGAG